MPSSFEASTHNPGQFSTAIEMTKIQFHSDLTWGKTEPDEHHATPDDATRISYSRSRDGELAAFDRSPQGAELRTQYRANIGKLQNFLRERGPVVNGQETALNNLSTLEHNIAQGIDGPYSTTLHALYGPGKEALDNIATQIDQGGDAVKLDMIKGVMVEKALGMGLCGPGAASHLMMAAQDIHSTLGGVSGYAELKWATLFDQSLLEFVKPEHGREPNYPGEEVHLANQYRNRLADEFHVDKRPDDFTPVQVTPERIERCCAFLKQRVTPDRLLRVMAEECLQTIQDHLLPYRDRPLDETEAWELRQKYENSLGGSLTLKYGEIEPGLIVNEHHGQHPPRADQEDSEYRLIDNPTLLMRAIGKNLFKAGIFDNSYKPTRLVGQKGDEKVFKQVGGDAFYTRAGRGGLAAYRPLRVNDLTDLKGRLPDTRLNIALLREALVNTLSPTLLAEVDPKQIWVAVASGMGPLGMLDKLGQPEIRRYRQANASHGDYLIEQAAQAINTMAPERRQKMLVLVSARGESDLAVRVAVGLDTIAGQDPLGRTVLHHAVLNRDGPLLAALVGKSAQIIDQPDHQGLTPVMLAARNGHAAEIGPLRQAGANIDHKTPHGATALMMAAQSGHAAAIDALLQAGANVNEKKPGGFTALMMAADKGHADALDALLQAGANVDEKIPQGATALLLAAQNGHVAAIGLLLQAGANVNNKDQQGATALLMAAQNGHAAAIPPLLQAGAHVDHKNRQGTTALMLAALRGHAAAIDALILAGASVDQKNQQGIAALMLAAEGGHAATVRALLQAGANINDKPAQGLSALMLAALNGHTAMVDLLLQAGAHVDEKNWQGFTAVMLAALNGHAAAISPLMQAGANVEEKNHQGFTALMLAAQNGHAAIIGALLQAGANVDEKIPQGATALLLAAQNGHVAAIGLLLQAGANVNNKDQQGATALMHAAQNGHIIAINPMLKAGANINDKPAQGLSALMLAALNGHTAMVDLLLQAGAHVDEKNWQGFTAVMLAALNGHAAAISPLMQAGANVEEKNHQGFTALMLTAQNGHAAIISALLQAGANINEQNHQGATALMMAALNGRAAAIVALLQAGANVDQRNQQGSTALMHAAQNGHRAAITTLLQAGADINEKNHLGFTALMLAVQYHHTEAVSLLWQAKVESGR